MSKNINKAKINVQFNEAESLENINSGESINTLFGKISKVITEFISHIGNSSKHTTSVELTQSEYNALSDDEKNNGTVYYVTDVNDVEQQGIIDYTSQITLNTDIVAKTWTTSIKKIGTNINFVINITVNAYSGNSIKFGTLPEAVRPNRSFSSNTLCNTGAFCYVFVNSDGSFGATKLSGSSWTANDGVRFCFSYITSN